MKIKSIKPIDYIGDVYNLRIKSDTGLNHNYIADGLNVSNCHKAKSKSIQTIMDKCWHCDYRFGLSGTIPKKGTVDRLALMSAMGPLVTQVKAKHLQDEGHIANCKVYRLQWTMLQMSRKKHSHSYLRTQNNEESYLHLKRTLLTKRKTT